MSPDDSVDTWGKKLHLARTITKINKIFSIHKKLKMVAQNCRKTIFEKSPLDDLTKYTRGQKFCRNCCCLHGFHDQCDFVLHAEIQGASQKWWENNFGVKGKVNS